MRSDAVAAHFQEDAGEDHGDWCGGFDVCIGQPGVERDAGDFDYEADAEQDEGPPLQRVALPRGCGRKRSVCWPICCRARMLNVCCGVSAETIFCHSAVLRGFIQRRIERRRSRRFAAA